MQLALITCLLLVLSAQGQQLSGSWVRDDRVYFDEQFEYLQLVLMICKDERLILWGDGRCYREFERGPCFADRVLVLDREQLKPYCKPI